MPPKSVRRETIAFRKQAEDSEATEPGVPLPPAELAQWLEDQVRLGLVRPKVFEEFREANGLPPKQLSIPGETVAPTHQVSPRTSALDAAVSEGAWRSVFEAYATTGDPGEIASITGLGLNVVKHLLSYGIRRLGLKPIREAAVDYHEVEARANALVKREPEQHLVHLANAREAATERVSKEAAAAQALLISSMKTSDAFLGYVNKFLERTMQPDGYDIPEQITVGALNKLADTANKLATAVDKAVRLSRFAAGEPDHNVALEISTLVCRMNEDDLRFFNSTGRIPPHLRIKASNFIDADFEEADPVEPPPPLPPPPPPEDE